MTESPVPGRWVVVALFERLPVGSAFSRRRWPAHLTLASNFAVDASAEYVALAVQRAAASASPLVVEFAGRAMFGRDRDIPVQLVRSPPVAPLHALLADQLEPLPGFVAVDPDFWRGGYRPHVTLRPDMDVNEGDQWTVSGIAVAHLLGSTATVSTSFDVATR